MARTPLIIGNWKMNLLASEAMSLAAATARRASEANGRVQVGVAPSSLWIRDVIAARGDAPLEVWGQQIHASSAGAFTGECSAEQLASAGAAGALVGHSERRHVFGESDEATSDRVGALRRAGLRAVLCVGETLAQREAERTWNVIERQLLAGCADLTSGDALVVAYEPVWAIGTGRTATPEQAESVHRKIHAWLGRRFGGAWIPVLYGGSVKPENAAALLSRDGIDGLLVGGASLTDEAFGGIIAAAAT